MADGITHGEAVVREYEAVQKEMLQVYQYYFRCLAMIIIGAGAVGATVVGPLDQDKAGLLSIILTLIINTWVAGWAYLHLEQWSRRQYLAKLEVSIRKKMLFKDDECAYELHSSGLNGMYKAKLFGEVGCHVVLDVCFVAACAVIYLVAYAASLSWGFEAIPRLELLNPFWSKIIAKFGFWLFMILSPGCLFLTWHAWRKVISQWGEKGSADEF